SGKTLRVITDKQHRLSSFVKGLTFSPRGDLLVLACREHIIGWDPATGDERFTWKDDAEVRALSPFFEDGKKIASFNERGVIRVWDVATGKPVQTLNDGGKPYANHLAVSADGKTLVSRASGPFKVWDLATGSVRKEITDLAGTYLQILVLPDNRTVAWTT